MTERVIGKATEIDVTRVGDANRTVKKEFVPDPDAPSVSEVVEALVDARNASEGEDKRWGGEPSARTQRLDALIARLEGGET